MILMDLEYTCWEGSLRSGWSDTARPAEVIEIGLAAFDFQQDTVLDTFSTLVRPKMNPLLSEYCKSLLQISQKDIDRSPSLHDALDRVAEWDAHIGAWNVPTCSWGSGDRICLTLNAERSGCTDPFFAVAHVDLSSLMSSTLVPPLGVPLERDDVRAFLGLSLNGNRHRALDDALDLAQFCRALRARHLSLDDKGEGKPLKI